MDYSSNYFTGKYGKDYQITDPYSDYNFQPNTGLSPAAIPKTQSQGIDAGQTASAGLSGAAVGGPAGAAIAAGGSLASQYLAQKAADERAKREQIGQAYAKQASDEQNIINNIMSNNARALR